MSLFPRLERELRPKMEPKFVYKTKVRIKRGFYRGAGGTVDRFIPGGGWLFKTPNEYSVTISLPGGEHCYERFVEDDLEVA